MKKILLSALLISSLALGNNAIAGPYGYSNGPSEASVIGGSLVILSVAAIPVVILSSLAHGVDSASENLSSSHHPHYTYMEKVPTKMYVNNITNVNNTNVNIQANVTGEKNEQVNFQVPRQLVEKCNLQNGTEIKVSKNEIGYVLNANNKVIGVIPNDNTNKLLKQEKI